MWSVGRRNLNLDVCGFRVGGVTNYSIFPYLPTGGSFSLPLAVTPSQQMGDDDGTLQDDDGTLPLLIRMSMSYLLLGCFCPSSVENQPGIPPDSPCICPSISFSRFRSAVIASRASMKWDQSFLTSPTGLLPFLIRFCRLCFHCAIKVVEVFV